MYDRVYKICKRTAWTEACRTGELEMSAADARDGFVHLSTAAQLAGTASRHFRGERELVLLEVPVERLAPHFLKWEPARDGDLFPHWYAPLRAGDVARTFELETGDDGVALIPKLG